MNNVSSERHIEHIPLERLQFDPQNPRLPTSVRRDREADLLRWMLEDSTLTELMVSIAEQGYFSGEPLLVVQSNVDGST